MNEAFVIGLVVGVAVTAAFAFRASANERHPRGVSRLEAKLDALLQHTGIEFDPYTGVPPPVVDALRRGKKIEAIKEYRSATGADLKQAKEYVEEIERRALG